MGILYACIFLLEFIYFIYCADKGHVSVYFSIAYVQGSRDKVTGSCNATGLIKKEVVIDNSSSSKAEKAWIGAFAEYSPWVEFRGCGQFLKTSIPQNTTFTYKPNLNDCIKTCTKSTTFVSLSDVACYCIDDDDFNLTSYCNHIHICNNTIDLMCGDEDYRKELVLYMINSTFTVRNETPGQCGIVSIWNGAFEFGSQDCSWNASAICSENMTITANVTILSNWTETVLFCNRQNKVLSYQNVITNKTISSVQNGTYWISSFRGVSLHSFQETNSTNHSLCVAGYIENNKRIRPEISLCEMELRVVCLSNATNNETSDCSSTTNEEKNKIWVAAIGGGVLLTIIIGLIVLIRCKFGKTGRTQEALINSTISYAEISKGQSQTDREMLVSKAQSQPERYMMHKDDGIYDHTETSARRDTKDKDTSKNYDTMENIKQETEGLYDHNINTGASAIESITLEPEGLYDNA